MVYRLDVFRDAALSERVERLSLSAPSDAQAVESRVLVLSRGDGGEVARMGSRRLSGYGD